MIQVSKTMPRPLLPHLSNMPRSMRALTESSVFFMCLFASAVGAAEFAITVTGTDEAVRDVPVKVAVQLAEAPTRTVAIDGLGDTIFGQLTKPSLLSPAKGQDDWELNFVIPQLKARETVKLRGRFVNDELSGFEFSHTVGLHSTLSFEGRPVFRCMYEKMDESSEARRDETYKVFHHVYDPQGTRYVTKGPGGLFPHHRGLFYGFNRITYGDQKADIWHCRNGEHQSHDGFVAEETGHVLGRQLLDVGWHGQDGHVFAEEERELTAYNVPGGLLIEFASLLTSKVGLVKLDGDPQHAGFQFRGSQDIPDKTKELTYYVRPDGKGEPGQFRNWSAKEDESEINLRHINLSWNALCFVLDGQRYTCCYLDHPQNPKPARYSERDYGRFGSYFEYDLDEDHPLRLNYRIWLQAGEMTVEEIDKLSRGFTAAPIARAEVVGVN